MTKDLVPKVFEGEIIPDTYGGKTGKDRSMLKMRLHSLLYSGLGLDLSSDGASFVATMIVHDGVAYLQDVRLVRNYDLDLKANKDAK